MRHSRGCRLASSAVLFSPTNTNTVSLLPPLPSSKTHTSETKQGAKKMGVDVIDGLTIDAGEPAEEFEFPDPSQRTVGAAGAAKPKAKPAVAKKAAGAADLDATSLSAVPLTAEEAAAKVARDAKLAATAANATAAGFAPRAGVGAAGALPGAAAAAPSPRSARSAAGGRTLGAAAAAAATVAAIAAAALVL